MKNNICQKRISLIWKKLITVCFCFIVVFYSTILFAQTAKIVDIQGNVFAREKTNVSWVRAKINTFLNKEAELKTEMDSSCTLAFDEKMKNVLTVGENSQLKIENIKPGNIFLNRGRVFSLVENIENEEKFQVRTPVAIAGARGTGWVTSHDGKTAVHVFEETVFVQGLGKDGKVIKEEDLENGFGLGVGPDGFFGDRFPLTDRDYEGWDKFSNRASVLLEQKGADGGVDGGQGPQGGSASIDDFLWEIGGDALENLGSLADNRKEDLRELNDEDARRIVEGGQSQNGCGNEGNNEGNENNGFEIEG